MSFRCPACKCAGTLVFGSCLDVLPDSRSDEITVQALSCLRCGFPAVAVYEESRRGSLENMSSDHLGFELSE